MSALGHYLEVEGIPTVQISLVREHTQALAAPRALWVPFMLGRPFGVPGDAAFQTRVLRSALELLERADDCVLEAFPEDAPETDAEEDLGELVCPISFPTGSIEGGLRERLRHEVAQLGAWHDVATRLRGRSTLGVTGLTVDELAQRIGAWAEGDDVSSFRTDLVVADAVRLTCDELRAYYYESKSVQPGKRSSNDVSRWFWLDTAAGESIRSLRSRLATHEEPAVKALAASGLVPRAVDEMLSA